jgi:ParB-like chromosome segregation protein Spo0J
MNMKIELWPIEKLIPYDNNPRKNDGAVKAVAKSIKDYGFKNPIIVDEKGVILAGHTRKLAAEQLKLKQVPVIVASDLTQEQARQFRLIDNSTASIAEWELEKLMQECAAMPQVDFKDFGLDLEAELLKAQGLTPDDGSEDSQEGVKQNDKITVIIDDMSQKAEIKAAIMAAIDGLEAHVK